MIFILHFLTGLSHAYPQISSTEATQPYWLMNNPQWQGSTGTPPKEVDTVIIGGGFTGMSTAYWLRMLQPNSSLAVLEARGLSSGATGRNGGSMSGPVFNPSTEQLKAYPISEWEHVSRVRLQNQHLLEQLMAEHPGLADRIHYRRMGSILAYKTTDEAKAAKLLIERNTKTNHNYGNSSYLNGKECENRLGARAGIYTGCLFTYGSFELWPARLVWALADYASARGAQICTNTRVLSVTPSTNGWKIVDTERGQIKARRVVYATNAYTASLLTPSMRARLPVVPTRGQCISTIGALTPPLAPGHRYPSVTANMDKTGDYHTQRPDGSVVLGGFRWQAGQGSGDVGVTNDMTKDPIVARSLRQYLVDNFVALRNWTADTLPISSDWTGIMGFSPDGQPQVGPLPGQRAGAPGTDYVAIGFTGTCMSRGFRLGQSLARIITGTSTYEEEIPEPWRTGRFDR